MKILFKFACFFALWGSIASCETVLDQEPVSQISQSNFWQTPDDAEAALIACYDGLQNALSANFIHWGEARADAVTAEQGSVASAHVQALARNTLDANNNFTNWAGLYRGIARTNGVLAYVPEIPGLTELRRSQILAEASFLRAIMYFYAVRLWGDVPYIDRPYTSSSEDFNVTRTPAATVLDRIEEDLAVALAHLPPTWSAATSPVALRLNKGKATLGAARALLANVYMWRAGYEGKAEYYQRAADMTAQVMTGPYSLVPTANYGTIFTQKNTTESIFELQFNFEQQETNNVGNLFLWGTLGGGNAYQPSPKFVAAIEPGDIRPVHIYETLPSQLMVIKYYGTPGGGTIRLNDDNLIISRLAGIILLRAEALNRINRKTEAIAELNRIRQRAGLPGAAVTAASSTEAIESAILKERLIELSFEGHRYFDLVRTRRAVQEIPSINDERNLLWPVHVNELIRNPQLVQNEYYR